MREVFDVMHCPSAGGGESGNGIAHVAFRHVAVRKSSALALGRANSVVLTTQIESETSKIPAFRHVAVRKSSALALGQPAYRNCQPAMPRLGRTASAARALPFLSAHTPYSFNRPRGTARKSSAQPREQPPYGSGRHPYSRSRHFTDGERRVRGETPVSAHILPTARPR